jgi:hypothetical protein
MAMGVKQATGLAPDTALILLALEQEGRGASMVNFFRRPAVVATKAVVKPAVHKPSPAPEAAQGLNDPLPVPEVLEGNENADWALWEDSVWAQDSQMQSLSPSARIYLKQEARPSQYQDLDDVFSSVNKKDP